MLACTLAPESIISRKGGGWAGNTRSVTWRCIPWAAVVVLSGLSGLQEQAACRLSPTMYRPRLAATFTAQVRQNTACWVMGWRNGMFEPAGQRQCLPRQPRCRVELLLRARPEHLRGALRPLTLCPPRHVRWTSPRPLRSTASDPSAAYHGSSQAELLDPSNRDETEDAAREWTRTMAALQDLITKRHREKLQTDSLEAMRDYLARLCLDVSKLKVVHVAGTKGKGSTCTMVESILRAQGLRTALYTSPHLIDVRERIRIDGKLLPKASFSEHFWRVHSQLRDTANAPDTRFQAMPGYFRFLTLLAFEVFLSQEVDVAIIEVGLGGRLDATNVVTPVVCGITSLDYDHTNVLGDTLAEIAGEKAGILKRHIPSFTVAQRPEALEVLRRRAEEVGSPLQLVPDLSVFSFESPATVQLGLEGEIQRTNCALAVTLANAFLAEADKEKFVTLTDRIYEFECMRNSHDGGPFHVPDAYRGALAASRMLARCQVRAFAFTPGRLRACIDVLT